MRLKVCRSKHINYEKQERQHGKRANTALVGINYSQRCDFISWGS